ncbi:tetratricopeptide repeat protein [Granulicella sp. L46]|uniref:tetratricopeptide repeat protein n=1 Tax=Granulicella sp. L46 TaxID=1641865 RepID=UPI00131D80F7|nr:tetratricopeptide repeat protein [Granulicella sp. L46]
MMRKPRKPAFPVQHRPVRLASSISAAIPFLCIFAIGSAPAQQKSTKKPAIAKSSPAATELQTRIAAASTARNSGDPFAVAQANQRLIATALRELANLRQVESAYPQAIELYRDSLSLEDSKDARLELAMAQAQSGHYDEAIQLAQATLAADPDNLQADRILASSLVQKSDFAQAIEPFSKVANADPSVENLYALANCLLQTRKAEDKLRAQSVFDRMMKISGNSGSLHVLFGRAYRDADDMPSAIREFQLAVAVDPRTPHAHYFLGLARLSLNEWKPTPEVEAEMRKEIEYFPHDYLANYMLGFLLSSERRYDESNKYLDAAAKIQPSEPEPFLYMGLNAYSQDNLKEAEPLLRKAVELTGADESRSNYQIRRAYVDLGRILSKSDRQQEADVFLAKARDLQVKTMEQSQQSIASIALANGEGSAAAVMPLIPQPEDAYALAPLGKTQQRIDDPLNPATLAQSKLTATQRSEADTQQKLLRATLGLAYNDLGTSEAVRGDYAHALSDYQQAERWDNSLPGLAKNLGQSAFRVGDYAEAIRGLTLALQQQPDSIPLRAMLGSSYYASNQYSDAVRTFQPLGARGMVDGEIGYAWADSLAHTGDMKRASEVLTAFQTQPRPPEVMLLVGRLWTEIGDYARAINTLQQALNVNPSLPAAHLNAGLAYIHWEHWPEAVKEFQEELAIQPDNPDAEYHLGFAYMQQSKLDDAVAAFRQVVSEYPDYGNAQYELGKILLDRGQVTDAVGYLEAAARLSPGTDYVHYQLQAAYRKEDRVAEADHELDIYKELKAKSRQRAASAMVSHP